MYILAAAFRRNSDAKMVRCKMELVELQKSVFFMISVCVLLCSSSALSIASESSGKLIKRQSTYCPIHTQCIPIGQCPMLNDILTNECVNTDKIGTLGCGYQGSGLVCCPQNGLIANTHVPAGKMVDGQRCGVSQIQGSNYDGIGAYPWVVRVGFRNTMTGEVKYPCAGTIINKRIILTAAHCALAKADNYKLFSVRVGEYDTRSDIDCGEEFCGLPVQDIALSHVIIHPGFQKQTYRHNIALLVLRSPINYTVTAQPICLPESWSVTNNNGLLVGWGRTAQQRVTPVFQQSLRLPIISIQVCNQVYGNTLPVNDEQLCAGGEAGNDACSGFGGSPLLVQHGDTYYQVGILSFGSDQCGAAGVPSVYTNIKQYTNWIEENIPSVYN